MIKKGLNFDVKTGFIADRSVDITSEDIAFSALVSEDWKTVLCGFQVTEPLHSDEDKKERLKELLCEISKKILEVKEIIEESKKAS